MQLPAMRNCRIKFADFGIWHFGVRELTMTGEVQELSIEKKGAKTMFRSQLSQNIGVRSENSSGGSAKLQKFARKNTQSIKKCHAPGIQRMTLTTLTFRSLFLMGELDPKGKKGVDLCVPTLGI